MAGGPLANETTCMVCLGDGVLTRATRVVEGVESDQYRCDAGHEFGMDFPKGPATESDWPPSEEMRAFAAASKK